MSTEPLPLPVPSLPATGIRLVTTESGTVYKIDLDLSTIIRTPLDSDSGEPHELLFLFDVYVGSRFYFRYIDATRPRGESWLLTSTIVAIDEVVPRG